MGSGSIVGAAAPHQRHSTAVPPSFLQARMSTIDDPTGHHFALSGSGRGDHGGDDEYDSNYGDDDFDDEPGDPSFRL